ncbi:MAG: 2Fe-2S iron-sulfur cluster binding domain-containing protein [Spirochaetales bacterium]|nr:2Fe-2S iron-sulfur cluster binding domain-containing protein [Spirochaetales bacterium]
MILTAVIFINAFAVGIGILIIFLDNVISNYGNCRITINNDKEFEAPGGKSLLRVLFENKYFIPSACGGKGTCGYCRVKVDEGGGEALPTEALILSSKEIKAGFRLACQVKVREDLKIEIPPEYLEIQEYEGRLETSELVTSDIKKMDIKLITPEEISFKPGQYVQIKYYNPEGDIDYRAYSISSTPDEKNHIELNIKKIPEGLVSTYMHSLNAGDNIEFSGPYGDFYLRMDSHRKIVCVAGGVGLAPLKSIVLYWYSHHIERPLELYYGSRTIQDLYDHETFVKIAEENESFRYYPALMSPEENWQGYTGFVHEIIEEKLENGRESEAYLCGPPPMLDAAIKTLNGKGITEERIYFDKF